MMKLMIPISMTKNKQFNLIILFTFFFMQKIITKKRQRLQELDGIQIKLEKKW